MAWRSVWGQKAFPPSSPYTWRLDLRHLMRGARGQEEGWEREGGRPPGRQLRRCICQKRRSAETSPSPSSCLSTSVSPAQTDIFSKGSEINHHPSASYPACDLQTSSQRVAETPPKRRVPWPPSPTQSWPNSDYGGAVAIAALIPSAKMRWNIFWLVYKKQSDIK